MTKIKSLMIIVKVSNRFKELNLIDRVPDEIWTKVHDIVQETGIKTIPASTSVLPMNTQD